MKKLLLFLCVLLSFTAAKAQFVYKIKADSVLITNDSCTAELIIENSTKNVKGFLVNKGNGRTEFRRAQVLTDSSFIVAGDTIVIRGTGNFIKNDTTIIQNGGFKLGSGSKIEIDTLKIGNTSTGLNTDSVLVKAADGVVRKVARSGFGIPLAITNSITSATAGSVLYAGTGGVLQQSNNNFFYDSTNKRLGIGMSSPKMKLNVFQNVDNIVGINTTATNTFPSSIGATPAQYIIQPAGTYGLGIVKAATNTGGGILVLAHTRSADASVNSVLSSGDDIGNVIFSGVGSTSTYLQSARITARVQGLDATGAICPSLLFYTRGVDNTQADRMVITSVGNVGINTGSPQQKLHVAGQVQIDTLTDGTAGIDSILVVNAGVLKKIASNSIGSYTFSTGLTNSSGTVTNNLSTGVSGGGMVIGGTGTTDPLSFQTTTGNATTGSDFIWKGGNNGGTELARLSAAGNLGIGVTPTTSALLSLTTSSSKASINFGGSVSPSSPSNGDFYPTGKSFAFVVSGVTYFVPTSLTASAVLDFPNTNAGLSSDLTITLTGAADGDQISIGVPNAAMNANSCYTAWVSASNTVTIRFNNYSTGSINPSSSTFRVSVLKY